MGLRQIIQSKLPQIGIAETPKTLRVISERQNGKNEIINEYVDHSRTQYKGNLIYPAIYLQYNILFNTQRENCDHSINHLTLLLNFSDQL